jgi:hypothetical protein
VYQDSDEPNRDDDGARIRRLPLKPPWRATFDALICTDQEAIERLAERGRSPRPASIAELSQLDDQDGRALSA